MKRIAFAIVIMCLNLSAGAQKVFFIYLQSENRTPFYVRLTDKVFSSSSSGYLILSNLKDSVYTLSVGYPGSKLSESRFTIPVESSDKGLLLKNFDEGLGLFDLQSLVIHKPNLAPVQSEQMTSRTDSFTRRLAKAADDESLLTVPVVAKKEVATPKEPKKEPVIELVKTETKKEEPLVVDTSVAIMKTEPVKTEEKPAEKVITPAEIQKDLETKQPTTVTTVQPEPLKQELAKDNPQTQTISEEPFQRSEIKRRSESSTTEGFGLVYLDIQAAYTDTIRLLIPNPKKAVVIADPIEETEPNKPVVPDVQTIAPAKDVIVAPVNKKNNCNNIATEKDFLKLRKNMASETNDEEMIEEAKKYFRAKCFTTEQIRYLSTLFLTNAAKYQFFDAAYFHVSDIILFPSLGAEIKDEYYSKRFKALIGE